MFIYQNGKLYVQEGKKIVGVEIYSDNVIKVKGTQTALLDGQYEPYTATEVWKKFGIREDNPYIFPQEKKIKEVVANEPINDTKSTTKSKRK